MTNFSKVREFMRTAEQNIPPVPTLADHDTRMLRLKLINEEYKELEDAITEGDLVAAADALTDLLYVVYGAGLAFGIDLDRCFEEVHRSNMTKFPDGKVLKREDGKVIKPPTFEEPDLETIILVGKAGGYLPHEEFIDWVDDFEDVRNSGILEYDVMLDTVDTKANNVIYLDEHAKINIDVALDKEE